MAIRAGATVGTVGGVYAALRRELEERCERRPERVDTLHGGFFRCLDHRRLELMRAGEPVEVASWMLPEPVRASAAFVAAHRGVSASGTVFYRSQMAMVYPDDRVVYRAETARDWLAERDV